MDNQMTRRTFIKGVGVVAVAGMAGLRFTDAFAAPAEFRVPNSSGTEAPGIKVPAGACDCHHHIYDDRFPITGSSKRAMKNGSVADYRLLQKRLGTTRNIVVTPSSYGTDNSCTLDALKQFGSGARGVAVVDTTVTEAELEHMASCGVTGIRFTLFDPQTAVTSFDMIELMAERVRDLGFHVQLHWRADQIVDYEGLLQRITSPIVFDHMGRIPQPAGVNHPAFKIICRLIDKGQTWIKLSGAYQDSKIGEPTYADVCELGQAYVAYAPERMVWGSDWPHPTHPKKPNDAVLLDLLGEWAPDEAVRNRILVDNPAKLYGFKK